MTYWPEQAQESWESRRDGKRGPLMFFLVRLLINVVTLLVTAWLIPGIQLASAGPRPTANDWITLLVVALIFGVVNAIVRPVPVVLSLPLEIPTLGLFTFVINAFMLLLISWIVQGLVFGFRVDRFLVALLGAFIISIVSFILSRTLTTAITNDWMTR